ncbi:MAG TPA: hypothetical protein VEA63_13850, partial [Opitutus sp.]|nr:hypothetical protein [Opitutus sp.]
AKTPPLAAEISGDAPAPAPAVNQDVIAAWLVANGFQPATPAATDVDLLGTTSENTDLLLAADEVSNSPVVTGDSIATSGRGSGVSVPFVASDHAPRAVARAYTFTSPRLQTPNTENISEEPVAGEALAGEALAGEQPAATTARSLPSDNAAAAARHLSTQQQPHAAAVSDSRAMIPRAASLRDDSSLLPADVVAAETDATLDEAANRAPIAVAISPELTRAQGRAFAAHVQPTLPTPAKEAGTSSSLAPVDAAGTAENFAVQPETSRNDDSRQRGKGEKHSLSINAEEVTMRSSGFGINAAKTETLMSALATPAASSPPVAGIEHLSPAPAVFDALVNQAGHEATAMAQAARRSVDSALAVAEQFATGDKRAVTLQFSVSGVDLGVHVELRGDGVHTT